MAKQPAIAHAVYRFMCDNKTLYVEPYLQRRGTISCLVPQEMAHSATEALWENFIAPDIRLGSTSKVGHLLFVVVEREER